MTADGLWSGKSLERLHAIQARKKSIERMQFELARLSLEVKTDHHRELCHLLGVEQGSIIIKSTACKDSPDGHCIADFALEGPSECLICGRSDLEQEKQQEKSERKSMSNDKSTPPPKSINIPGQRPPTPKS